MTILVSLWALMCIALVCFFAGYGARMAQEIHHLRQLRVDITELLADACTPDHAGQEQP